MRIDKKTYATPQLKKIYAAPQLTKHGSVAKLTGSALPPHSINGNNINPPAISGAIAPGGPLQKVSSADQQKLLDLLKNDNVSPQQRQNLLNLWPTLTPEARANLLNLWPTLTPEARANLLNLWPTLTPADRAKLLDQLPTLTPDD